MGNIARRTIDSPDSYKLEATGRATLYDKIYLGVVKSVDDLQHMGRLKVWIAELGGDPNDSSTWFIVNYCSPFAGATNFFTNKSGSSYLDTQTSYGMWFVPPDVENQVIVAFINGDSAKGVWLGCLYQQYMNHMVPGIPGNNSSATAPVAEYNKKLSFNDITKPKRPTYSPLSDQLDKQGLSKDPVRGVTTSGARRDDPSNEVYGILTPGGNQFVFDDNAQNKFIRLRTQNGAQLLINDSTGCIYLNSVDGKNWISMDATGKIDVYAVDDITIRSQASVNIRGDLDVNIEAGRDINMRARGTPPITPVVNTSTPPLPSPQTIGPITVIGDSIAVGVGGRIESSLTFANVGDNSSQILQKVLATDSLANAVNTILSVGSNDSNQTLLASNLDKIRKALGKSNFIWLLPYANETNATVKTFASSKGDKYVDLTKYPSNDKIHPKDYGIVANDARALCVEAPPSAESAAETAAGYTQSGLKAEGSSWYNPGVYKTLEEAKAAQAKYRSMADNARANPQNYTDPPGGYLAVMKFEAAADAEVRRLSTSSVSATSTKATSTGSTYAFGARTVGSTEVGAPPVMSEEITQTTSTGTTTKAQIPSGLNFDTVAAEFIKGEEGFEAKAYIDPKKDPTSYSIGYGHCMGQNEMKTGRTYLDCGVAGQVPIKGQYGKDTTVTREQAEGLFGVDLRAFTIQCRQVLGGAWDRLNVYQQVAVADFNYNCGIKNLLALNAGNKFTDYIAQNEIKSAADLIRNFKTPNGSPKRRAKEAAYFEGHPELAPAGPSTTTPDGYPDSQTSGEGSVSPISTIKGGYIRMQSNNDMHLLSNNNMFLTTKNDQHRLTGANLYDSVMGGTSRYTAGSLLESVSGGYGIGVQGRININGARIDLNGEAPPAATPAVSAIGPRGQKQTDSILNSIGNATPILTDTILPHLPYHEPYQNHSGRNWQNIRNSTNTDKQTNLRDCEVVKDSDMPLDVYGTPRPDMPPGIYIGVQYSVKNTPIWNYNGPAMKALFKKASGLELSSDGRSFITSRENGSYRPLTIGNPTYTEIGYGHTLTPEEISQGYVMIKGETVRLNTAFTQQQINDLFDQDMTKVLNWMRPLITVGITQTQFDMLASLAWNIGEANFTKSDVVKYLNNGTLQKVPNSWMVFTVDANGQTVPGLVTRRVAEATNFMLAPSTDVPQGEVSVIPI